MDYKKVKKNIEKYGANKALEKFYVYVFGMIGIEIADKTISSAVARGPLFKGKKT